MNFVFILADDLGYGDIACYGNPYIDTPNIDRLAEEGVRLGQHYCASPLCSPSRAALQTGRYPHRTGGVDVPSNRGFDRIALSETTWADAFKAQGYRTGLIGKWHSGMCDMRYHPNQRGYEEFVGFLNGGMDYWKWVLERNGSPIWSDGSYLTDYLTDESIRFVERHKDEDFFLFLNYNAPHAPMQAPEALIEKYAAVEELNRNTAITYAMIESMDAGIGRLMDTLKSEGLDEDTVVVFTSDNGGFYGYTEPVMPNEGPITGDHPMHPNQMGRFNSGYRGGKMDVLEGGIRVPGIVRAPGRIPEGSVSQTMVDSIDWYPTLLDFAGIKNVGSRPLDGVSCLKVLAGEKDTMPSKRYWQFNRYSPVAKSNACIRDGKWKLFWPQRNGANMKDPGDNEYYLMGMKEPHHCMDIETSEYPREIGPIMAPCLYDLETDPGETVDLSAEEPERVRAMEAQWECWWEEMMADYTAALPATGRRV